MPIQFKRLTEADLPILTEWLNRPHVDEWWDVCGSVAETREEYLSPNENDTAVSYFAYLDDIPIGYVQWYVATASPDGWWPKHHDPGVHGIDQFLANGSRLDQGLGTQMVSEFVRFLFAYPSVTRIQADPAPSNLRAIRCYEKAGFRQAGRIVTPDGAAVLMAIDRPD